MHLEEMKLGKSIEILVTRDEYNFRLVSKVEDVAKEHICISMIAAKGKPFKFLSTDYIEFIYKDSNRMWKFTNVQAGITKLDDEYVHFVATKKPGKSYNRRNAYRVYYGEETIFHITKKENEEAEEGIRTFGVLKDISETGACICLQEYLNVEDEVEFELPTEYGLVRCKGNIVREAEEVEGKYHHLYGVGFTETTRNIQKFIFALQRLQLQKRK